MQIAIIGAGIAGVSAARALQAQGHATVLFDKARAVGGRCATRRWEGHVVDHGAQYLTIRDPRFREAVHSAAGAELQRLAAPVVDAMGQPLPDDGRWYHPRGNRALVAALADGLDIRLESPVPAAAPLLRRHGGAFDAVVSTAPLPQTAAIFGVEVDASYFPCLTLLLAYRGSWLGAARERYAVLDADGPLAWSACENHKAGRVQDGQTVFVAQLSAAFSAQHLEAEPLRLVDIVRPLLEARWALPAARFVGAYGHRWRYARVTAPHAPTAWGADCYYVGDATRASRVEDAWLAGADVTLG